MKAVNYIANAALIVVMAMGLGACGKKSNGSAAAAAGQCTYNGYSYVNGLGQPCTNAGQIICPANGIYTNQYGQQQSCMPGQVISQYPTNPGYPSNYPNPVYSSCQQYTQMYGVPYVPMILQNQFVCVRYDLLQQQPNYNYGNYGNYYNDYDYYYAYPPYSGGGCGTSIDFGGSWGSIGICF